MSSKLTGPTTIRRTPHAKSCNKPLPLSVTGQTEDGKLVVGNVFENVSSRLGLPLEFVLDVLDKHGMVVDWVRFYEDSMKSGWSYKTLRLRVDSSIGDVYGSKYRDEVLTRLDCYHDRKIHGDKRGSE